MAIISNILRIAVIILVTAGFTAIIQKDRKAKSQSSSNENEIILELPRMIFWIGIVTAGIFAVIAISLVIGQVSMLEIGGMTCLFMLSALMASAGAFWRVVFSRKNDYFDYTTCFGRKYKIHYRDISKLSVSGSVVSFKSDGKRFVISSSAINYRKFTKFIQMNASHALPGRKNKKEGPLKRALSQLNDPLDEVVGNILLTSSSLFASILLAYALTQEGLIGNDRIIATIMALVLDVIGIGIPLLSIYSLNHREKHPRLLKLLFKESSLKGYKQEKRKRKRKRKR